MVKRDELIKFIESTLGYELLAKAARVDPDNANGIQYLGQEEVTKVALGVTADSFFFRKAKSFGAEFLVVHHGLRLAEAKTRIPVTMEQRLQVLFAMKATLSGFHFSLDHHPVVGNNARLIKLLGAQKTVETFYREYGWIGDYRSAQDIQVVVKRCRKVFKFDPPGFFYGPKKIKRMAVVSGGGAPYPYSQMIWDCRQKGIDLYLTGIAKQSTEAICREAGINYLYPGHYNTEVFGVKALGEKVKKAFPGLKVKFIDIPNQL